MSPKSAGVSTFGKLLLNLSIMRWNVAGAFFNSNGIRLNTNIRCGFVKAVLNLSSSDIFTRQISGQALT